MPGPALAGLDRAAGHDGGDVGLRLDQEERAEGVGSSRAGNCTPNTRRRTRQRRERRPSLANASRPS